MQLVLSAVVALIALVIALKIFGWALSLLWTVLIGLVIGAVAVRFVKTNGQVSKFALVLYGIGGSIAGKAIGGLLGLGSILTLGVSVVAAALLIGAVHGR